MNNMDSDDDAARQRNVWQGQQCLAAGDRVGAAQALLKARTIPETRLVAHNLIEQHELEGSFAQMMGLNCQIAERDDIFHFFAGHPTSNNPLRDYLADGWRTLSELMQLLESVDRPLLRIGTVLEFASGHGRFTRHLIKALGTDRVTVSDVVPNAMDFAQQVLGVKTLASTTEPEALRWPQRFDLVFVLSLFSHLPRGTWGRWLERLYDAVAPGGLLVFSTHGVEAARRQGLTLDGDGYFFAASSESHAIDAQEYGTTFTDESFVRAALEKHISEGQLLQYASTWFWNHQDAWVVQRT